MPQARRTTRRPSGGRSSGGQRDSEFIGIVGFLPFDPDDDTTNDGDPIRRVKIQDGKTLFSATVWPSHDDVELHAGMVVAVQGQYTKREADDGTFYHNVSCNKLFVLGEDDHERGSRDEPKKGSSRKPANGGRKRREPEPVDDDDDDGDDF